MIRYLVSLALAFAYASHGSAFAATHDVEAVIVTSAGPAARSFPSGTELRFGQIVGVGDRSTMTVLTNGELLQWRGRGTYTIEESDDPPLDLAEVIEHPTFQGREPYDHRSVLLVSISAQHVCFWSGRELQIPRSETAGMNAWMESVDGTGGRQTLAGSLPFVGFEDRDTSIWNIGVSDGGMRRLTVHRLNFDESAGTVVELFSMMLDAGCHDQAHALAENVSDLSDPQPNMRHGVVR